MPEKVRWGLGLVVVALIALLAGAAVTQGDGPVVVTQILGLAVLACGAVGLVLVAWGLLRG